MEERDVRARTQLGLTTPIEKAPADDLPPPDFDKWWRENWDSHFTKEFVWRAFNDGALAARAERDEANNELAREIVRQAGLLAERDAKVERLRGALEKISAIRDDIVGRQTINWSAHIYPLVAALEEAGFEGAGYEEARTKAKTQDDRIAELEEKLMVMCVAQIKAAENERSLLTRARNALSDIWLAYSKVEGDRGSIVLSHGALILEIDNYLERLSTALKLFVPSPDPPAPAPLAAQGVEGDPHHER